MFEPSTQKQPPPPIRFLIACVFSGTTQILAEEAFAAAKATGAF